MKAVIFDLDGTLVDSISSIANASNKALKECGLSERNIEEYKYFAGDGALELLKRACYASGDTEYKNIEKISKIYKEIFEKDCTLGVVPFENIQKMLDILKNKEIKIAILSNKPHDRAIDVVEKIFGKDYFDYILGYKDEETKKPSPYGALLIAKELGVLPEECIYVGDTDTDMQTGKNAKMFTVGVTWGFRDKKELKENGVDKIIDCPLEIIDLI
ncbi:MAG: HAD family hydrolase [Eubacteriales bacterium]|nr:HAD family hydrolase [Eubacteriales bacterium]